MVYRTTFFHKEFRQAYSEYRVSLNRMFMYGAFLGLVSFGFHFLLQTVYESVLTESLPELMLPSYFSVIFAYTNIAYVFFMVYVLTFYKYLTFSEIRDNSWYLLVKMGYSPIRMILTKLYVRMLSVFITYTVGFATAILLTVFLKYPFVIEYFFPVYISGLFDILIIVMITMTSSLFIRLFDNARIVIVASAFVMFSLKIFTGYYSIVSNRTMMRDPFNLIRADKSIYFLLFAVFILSCFAICIQRARFIAQYYNITSNQYSGFAIQDYKTNEIKTPVVAVPSSKTARRINRIAISVLIFIISCSVLINVAVLAVSAMSPDKEVSFMGVVPYVFQSDSMKPTIQKNDLVFFETTTDPQTLVVGDIVLFRESNEIYIERIVSVNGSVLTVDIDYYPDLTRENALKKEISDDLVYGTYSGGNRWLGAMILFANSFFGRMILLLIPAILVFFYKPITRFFGIFSKSEKV